MPNTSSGTSTFDKTFYIDEIMEEAYERLGVQDLNGYRLKSARRSLNIMFQEWGNRGLHYWELKETNINLVEGQAEYHFFRSAADDTSDTNRAQATTVQTDSTIFGMDDVLEATYRTSRGTTSQADVALQGDISGMTASLGVAFNSTFIALLISILLMFLLHQIQQMYDKLVLDAQGYCDKFFISKIY